MVRKLCWSADLCRAFALWAIRIARGVISASVRRGRRRGSPACFVRELRATCAQHARAQSARQDPGRYFAGTVVPIARDPHTQPKIVALGVYVKAVPAALTGTSVTTLPSTSALMFFAVTLIAPSEFVSTLATYFEVGVELSQPQLPAAMEDWPPF